MSYATVSVSMETCKVVWYLSSSLFAVNVVILVLLVIAFLIVLQRNLLNLNDFLRHEGPGNTNINSTTLAVACLQCLLQCVLDMWCEIYLNHCFWPFRDSTWCTPAFWARLRCQAQTWCGQDRSWDPSCHHSSWGEVGSCSGCNEQCIPQQQVQYSVQHCDPQWLCRPLEVYTMYMLIIFKFWLKHSSVTHTENVTTLGSLHIFISSEHGWIKLTLTVSSIRSLPLSQRFWKGRFQMLPIQKMMWNRSDHKAIYSLLVCYAVCLLYIGFENLSYLICLLSWPLPDTTYPCFCLVWRRQSIWTMMSLYKVWSPWTL